jgi:integrase
MINSGYDHRRNPALPAGNSRDMDAFGEHLEQLRLLGHSGATIYGRATFLRMLARHLPVPLLDATPEMLAQWRAGLSVSNEVIVHYVGHAQSFYAFCVERSYCAVNPAQGLPVPRVPRRLPRPVSELDLMRALALATPRIRPWLVLAGWAGLRAKEIAYLRRESVLETARPPVLIVASDATKGRSERAIPLSAFAVAELVPVLPASGWVFTRRDGRKGPNSPGLISHLANCHLHEAGVNASLHQLRHRFLSQAWRASHDIRLVQDLAGHASPQTTAGYTEVDRPEAAAAVEAIPAPARLRAVSELCAVA